MRESRILINRGYETSSKNQVGRQESAFLFVMEGNCLVLERDLSLFRSCFTSASNKSRHAASHFGVFWPLKTDCRPGNEQDFSAYYKHNRACYMGRGLYSS
jgi:hypothetical protein